MKIQTNGEVLRPNPDHRIRNCIAPHHQTYPVDKVHDEFEDSNIFLGPQNFFFHWYQNPPNKYCFHEHPPRGSKMKRAGQQDSSQPPKRHKTNRGGRPPKMQHFNPNPKDCPRLSNQGHTSSKSQVSPFLARINKKTPKRISALLDQEFCDQLQASFEEIPFRDWHGFEQDGCKFFSSFKIDLSLVRSVILVKDLPKALKEQVQTITPLVLEKLTQVGHQNYVIKKLAVLRSPGVQDTLEGLQRWHKDYPDYYQLPGNPPMSVILSISSMSENFFFLIANQPEQGGRLDTCKSLDTRPIYDNLEDERDGNGYISSKDHKQTVIPQGHMMILHGFLFHRGTAYRENNYRIHYYLVHKDDPQFGKKTQRIPNDIFQ